MNTGLKKYSEDILLSIDISETDIRDVHSSDDYEANIIVTNGAERRLAIIGEAMNHINKADKTLGITDKTKMISLRHILIHEYDLIEDTTIWNIIFANLLTRKKETQAILNSIN